jgi:DNA-binding NtrC family response regulator
MANILVIDDEKNIRFTMNEFLKEDGHDVYTADDAFSALEILKKQPIDLIISDIILPRIKGTDLIFTIRAVYPGIKLLLITGQPSHETEEIGKKAGAFAYLAKPISKLSICETVQRALAD